MNAIRRILTFLLIIPLGMIVYVWISPDWQWEHPDLEFPFLIIGIPIVVLNFFLWFRPEFFQPYFYVYENPVQIPDEKLVALLKLAGALTALIFIGVGTVSLIARVSAPPILETPATQGVDVADFPAFGGSPSDKTPSAELPAAGLSSMTLETSGTGATSTPTPPTAVAQIPISGGEPTSTPASPGIPTKVASPTIKPTNTANPSEGCARATSEYLEVIGEAIFDIDFNYIVETGWAVQSNEAENLRFVAAKIYGDDIESGWTLPGVWGLFTDSDGYIDIYAINDVAQEYSYSLWGEDSEPELSMESNGAQSAYDCALSGN